MWTITANEVVDWASNFSIVAFLEVLKDIEPQRIKVRVNSSNGCGNGPPTLELCTMPLSDTLRHSLTNDAIESINIPNNVIICVSKPTTSNVIEDICTKAMSSCIVTNGY